MRTMLRVQVDAVTGSKALKAGAMPPAIMDFGEKFKPEATYFTAEHGMRTCFFVLEMQGSQQMPEIGEPFFDLGCNIFPAPCMTPADLQSGFAAVGR